MRKFVALIIGICLPANANTATETEKHFSFSLNNRKED